MVSRTGLMTGNENFMSVETQKQNFISVGSRTQNFTSEMNLGKFHGIPRSLTHELCTETLLQVHASTTKYVEVYPLASALWKS